MSPLLRFFEAARHALLDGAKLSLKLYRVVVPLIIVIKILSELDLIKYLAMPLAPLMALMGLPEDLGIVWAVGMIVNPYSSLIVFASLLPTMEVLSVAQVSIFSLILLYAHSLPIECRIAQQCGLSLTGQLTLRLAVAISSGVGLHLLFTHTGWFSEPATILFASDKVDPTLLQWAWGEIVNLVSIFLIISVLLLVQKGIDYFNITRWLELVLMPLLRAVGVSNKAASTILIGMAMGLIYGSGLIIRAAQDGSMNKRDVFGSITLMGLAHAIIEDTLLLMVAGAHWSIVLVLRSLTAIGVCAVATRAWARAHPADETA